MPNLSKIRFLLSWLTPLCVACGFSGLASADSQTVDNFAASPVGGFPSGWDTYPLQMGKAKKVYKIEQEGSRKYLRAVDDAQLSATIFHEFDWNLGQYPYLKFQWRARKLPDAGMAPDNHPINDHACGVYVDFGRSRALKYVWSSAMQPDSYWAKKPGKFVVVSKEYGPASLGQWRSVTINVPVEYQRYFSEAVKNNPSGIGLLTDADNTNGSASCDYADFEISSQP